MKIIGIDFGSKRVGVSIADTEAGIAFPKCVLERGTDFFENFKKICSEEEVSLVVLGESKDFNMKDNPIMKEIAEFQDKISKEIGLRVILHPEFLTSVEALRGQEDTKMLDASSATIILQNYLDQNKSVGEN